MLHQLNAKNNFRQYKSATQIRAASCQRRTEPAALITGIHFHQRNGEQININNLSKRGPGISQPGSWPAVGANVRKRALIHQLKVIEEWTSAILPSEQDDIVNSLNYEGITDRWVAVFTTFLTVTDCVLAPVTGKIVWMINGYYGDRWSSHQSFILLSCFHQRCLNCSECFQRTPYVLYMQLQHQGNS